MSHCETKKPPKYNSGSNPPVDTLKVAVVGQPNVGKSHLLNAISGSRLRVGNFAGVTIEKKEIITERNGYRLHLVDLPGIYSLHSYTPEEEITKRYLLEGDYDIILNVADCNVLDRNLQLTLQLLELETKVVVAANMHDEIQKSGGFVDQPLLSELLGIPVQLTSAREGEGIEQLLQAVIRAFRSPLPRNKNYFKQSIEEQVTPLADILDKSNLPYSGRLLSIRLLEDDQWFYEKMNDDPVFYEALPRLQEVKHHLQIEFDEDDSKTVLFEDRAARVRGMISQTVKSEHHETLTDRIDHLLIHPIWGVPIFLFLMWTLFQVTFIIGDIPVGMIEHGFDLLSNEVASLLPVGLLADALTRGVIPAVGTVISFLPNILILFLGLNLLEQTGYMARSAFLLDGILKRFGLQGNAFIPLVSGFGCSVPAYMAARTLKNPRDRLITMLVIGFMSCSARLPVYVLFIGAFFPVYLQGNVLFAIYILGALIGLIVAKILRVVLFRGMPEPFVMEMPKYRVPSLKAIGLDLYTKTMVFIRKAGTFIAAAAFLVWAFSAIPSPRYWSSGSPPTSSGVSLSSSMKSSGQNAAPEVNDAAYEQLSHSMLGDIGKFIQPVFKPMGFDWQMSVATLSALAAKEVAVSTLAVLYHQDEGAGENNVSLRQAISTHIDFKAAVAFILIMMTYSPCIAAMSTFYTEIPQWAWRLFYTIYPNVFAWLLGFSAYSLLNVLGF
ncbi:MAG TPA: ferrous iron transport protein B [Balneolaceae bacterium]|nr:ferrous iron transport protein B [Balneolaceae bacterium]